MYLVWTDTAEEFNRIKLTLGAGSKRVSHSRDLLDSLDRYPDCRIVIIGSGNKELAALELAASLRISHPFVNVILIRSRIELTTLSSALAAGIRDVVDAQDAAALVNVVKRCQEIDQQIASHSQHGGDRLNHGKVIVVYSAKGGCGKTTLSTNLAASLSTITRARICIVDLDLQFGDVAVALQLEPAKTISQALELGNSVDAQALSQILVRFRDDFDALLAPIGPSDYELISPEFIDQVISELRGMYDFVIVDSSPAFNDILIKVMELADVVLLLTTLDMPAIKNLKVALSTLDAVGIPSARRRVIVNRADAKVGLTIDDVEDFTGVSVFASIPSSAEVSASTNQGTPIVLAHPKHAVSRSIGDIARALAEVTESDQVGEVA
jgi:pilus assembly protein CpaE